jgi:hypothetical protein
VASETEENELKLLTFREANPIAEFEKSRYPVQHRESKEREMGTKERGGRTGGRVGGGKRGSIPCAAGRGESWREGRQLAAGKDVS